MCPRHQTGLNRKTKDEEEEVPYYCNRDDCKRVIWVESNPDHEEKMDTFAVSGCYECGRETQYIMCAVPGDTIFIDVNGDPVPKSEEQNVPLIE